MKNVSFTLWKKPYGLFGQPSILKVGFSPVVNIQVYVFFSSSFYTIHSDLFPVDINILAN